MQLSRACARDTKIGCPEFCLCYSQCRRRRSEELADDNSAFGYAAKRAASGLVLFGITLRTGRVVIPRSGGTPRVSAG
jgi:hypothetical protein